MNLTLILSTLLIMSILKISITTDPLFDENARSVSKNGMEIKWRFDENRIYFEMKAPTKGWLAIGFNEASALKGTYLIMGQVANHQAVVVEHFVQNPGQYSPIKDLGGTVEVQDIVGWEEALFTKLSFSLPLAAVDHYRKSLTSGANYNLLIAYSQEDDFQHHSVMRTSVKIQL
jgi:hypothetical protein